MLVSKLLVSNNLVSSATPEEIAPRITSAVRRLPTIGILGQRAAHEASDIIEKLDLTALSQSDLRQIEIALRAVSSRYGAYAPPGIDRDSDGKPYPRFGSKFKFIGFTDCVGGDPETANRIAIEEGSILTELGNGEAALNWQATEPLNPAHIRGIVTSTYLAYLGKIAESVQEPLEQFVILANAAPRDPNNPDAKGCPFVVALLEGDVIYVGTLNYGGVELQGIKDHVVEIWHTTLGVEETGVEGGKAPKSVFRSKHLLSLFREWHKGNGKLLDRQIDIHTISSIEGIQLDSRDSFGNLKTTASFKDLLESHDLKIGEWVELTIGDISHLARIAKSHGDGQYQEILIVPGSSPFSFTDASDTRADIVINHGDASSRFFNPDEAFSGRIWAGKKVKIRKLKKEKE